jgi:site-specific DNA-methyltransferase (adenine-specific)
MKGIPDKSIDLVLTDPPYGINYLSPRTDNHDKLENDEMGDWLKSLPLWLSELNRVSTELACCCCCCCGGGKTPVTAIFTIEALKHFNLIQTLVWRKFIGLGWRYRPSYENIVVLSKSKDDYSFYDESKKCSNVIEGINQDMPNSEEHPTQKPVELMKRLIKIHSKENDLILDPFCGGGTTAVACKELNRRYIGIEISPEYCEIARKRVERAVYQPEIL